ncbi:Alpha-1, 3-mannosyl-glycoprotein 2-beta-N-acetylglucosaminyltransferase isoform 2 [Schistosoma japonicum]|uniref:Alpha-1,3-mannosyl-glycoprotein 2-beta-N-acetylglucosaminyltransferase n=2 Tax=Schistosoma japonicum TaxID=6182 RepID=A0A4Z2DVT0_SCHJA|nr:Alpha-1, 3-mannosyl-glycoprotein 2-beta-N-acetylglucosaminyltransferase isoform 2 [Schistosoma japonicum]TNN20614.1 Alpha-1, 3-mannosyl-glycoprotein 2-beta-N-acetylglucosaminyltransferase isoform 2 [Schistosoma japonicum]TNN20615.1 Alpha-1, 3-mannosyl-glycoprotein 2-beta-N-acetylglucosaminyltransferase isoform 2 [Schistosoma japonicum]
MKYYELLNQLHYVGAWSWRRLFKSIIVELTTILLCVYFIFHFAVYYGSEIKVLSNLKNHIQQLSNSLDQNIMLQMKFYSTLKKTNISPKKITIPILVIACNRPTVKRPIDKLLQLKSEIQDQNNFEFPIFVSHGCDSSTTEEVLRSYQNATTVIKPNIPLTKSGSARNTFEGYRHVSHHYKWALDQIFLIRNYSAVIIVEDDLDLAPDFLSYFMGTYTLLAQDNTLFCVSAFNDNGRIHLIDVTRPDLLYRTDFFPGLGWMLLREFWLEIREGWPDVYWDEYMRKSYVRKGRACIRPEISRSITFGRIGISQGQYFDSHLKYIKLSTTKINFQQLDLSYLNENVYRNKFKQLVYEDSIEMSIQMYMHNQSSTLQNSQSIRIIYETREEFENIAKYLKIMPDFKSGVSRNAYMGVVPVYVNGHRLYIAPPSTWSGYNLSWV